MTRMWMVEPRILCRQHLLGEHKELHQLVGALLKGRMNVVEGHARLGQVECDSIYDRHEELVQEMKRREMNHNSPLPEFEELELGQVDRRASLEELIRRCPRCRSRYYVT